MINTAIGLISRLNLHKEQSPTRQCKNTLTQGKASTLEKEVPGERSSREQNENMSFDVKYKSKTVKQ